MSVTVLAGWDHGNSRSTLAIRVKGKVQTFTVPSLVGGGDLERLLTIRKAASSGGLSEEEIAIQEEGNTFFLGELAHQSRTATTQRGSLARYSNGHTLRLLKGLVGRCFREPVTLRMITGLPIKFMSEAAKRDVRRAYVGTHAYRCCGRGGNLAPDRWHDTTFEIESVGVLMEGAAVLWDVADQQVDQRIIDSGGGTLDLYRAIGRSPQYEFCHSFDDCGIDLIGDRLREKVLALPHGRRLDNYEIRNILYAYAAGDPIPIIKSEGHTLMLNGEIAASVASVGDDQIAHVRDVWEDTDGRVAAGATYARMCGGGTFFHAPRYKKLIPQLTTAKRPGTANAEAYLAVAEAATEEQWARNRG
jgi:Actin like proteins N terminal domain